MARKILFAEGGAVDGLVSLHTEDKEGLGVLYEDDLGNVYRYVKNASSTGLAAAGSCLKLLGQSTAKASLQRVLSPDAATGPATCLPTVAAGVPMTGIGASGSGTGAFGWILCEGTKKVSVWQSATAADQEAGVRAIATSALGWDKPFTSTVDSTNGGTVHARGIELAQSLTTTGVATAASAIAYVHCMP